MIGVPAAARIAGVELHDYDRAEASGVLVTSGTGIMLGVMDAAPCLRWCTDLDTFAGDRERYMFLRLLDGETPVLAIAGWWMVSNPAPVRAALAEFRRTRVLVHANVALLVSREQQSTGLDDLIAQLQALPPEPASEPVVRVGRLPQDALLSYDHHWL